MSTTAADSIAGVVIPDTELVREITAFIKGTEDDLLFDHSRRVFLFGVLHPYPPPRRRRWHSKKTPNR